MMWASETKPLGQWQITTIKINHDVNRSVRPEHKMSLSVYLYTYMRDWGMSSSNPISVGLLSGASSIYINVTQLCHQTKKCVFLLFALRHLLEAEITSYKKKKKAETLHVFE